MRKVGSEADLLDFRDPELRSRSSAERVTRSGRRVIIRAAVAGDLRLLVEMFRRVSLDDLRHRFLSAVARAPADALRIMTEARRDSITFLAFDAEGGELIASAMLTLDKDGGGEFALSTRSDFKGLGVSWSLLDHLADFAQEAGIRRLYSLETADDDRALVLEQEMGFRSRRCPDDATLMVAEKTLQPPEVGADARQPARLVIAEASRR